jgi:hypothetical protein
LPPHLGLNIIRESLKVTVNGSAARWVIDIQRVSVPTALYTNARDKSVLGGINGLSLLSTRPKIQPSVEMRTSDFMVGPRQADLSVERLSEIRCSALCM